MWSLTDRLPERGRLALLFSAAVMVVACGGSGSGGGAPGALPAPPPPSPSPSPGPSPAPGASDLYFGYYLEDTGSNPEDPIAGGLFVKIPAADAAFSGLMPFSYIGCTAGTDVGSVTGSRSGTSLSGNWSGTVDGVAIGGSFIGTYDATTDSFTGRWTNAAGKVRVTVGSCAYHVAALGTYKLYRSPKSEPPGFAIDVSGGTSPTISWSSIGANALYVARVFDEDCLNVTPSDAACFKGEAVTTQLTVAYPAGFPGAGVLVSNVNYLVLVTGQDTSGAFLGFSISRYRP